MYNFFFKVEQNFYETFIAFKFQADLEANIFTGEEEMFAFERTKSRLAEMQTSKLIISFAKNIIATSLNELFFTFSRRLLATMVKNVSLKNFKLLNKKLISMT